jgi:hypothetical protein
MKVKSNLPHSRSLYSPGKDRIGNTASNKSSFVACVSVAAILVYLAVTMQRMTSSGSIIPAFRRHVTGFYCV